METARIIWTSILVLGVAMPQAVWAASPKMVSHLRTVKAKPTVKPQQHVATTRVNKVLPGQVVLNNSATGGKTSTSLAKNCVSGSHFPTVTLHLRKAGGDASSAGKPFLQWNGIGNIKPTTTTAPPVATSEHEHDRLRHSGEVLIEMQSMHLGQHVVNAPRLAGQISSNTGGAIAVPRSLMFNPGAMLPANEMPVTKSRMLSFADIKVIKTSDVASPK